MRQPRVLHTLCSPACGPARGGPGAGKWGCAVPGDRVLRLPMDTGGAARRTSTQPSPRSPTRVPADAAAEHDVCRKAPPPRFSPRQPSRGRPAWSDPSLSHARGTVRAWAGLASEQIPPGPELLGVCRVQTPQLFESKVVVGRPREVSPWQRCRCPTWPDRFSVPFVTAPERAGRTMDHTPFPVGPVASGARPQWFQDETHPPVGWGLGSQRPGGPRAAA